MPHPDMMDDGWTFSTDFPGTTGDSLFEANFVREIYAKADPKFTGRVTHCRLLARRIAPSNRTDQRPNLQQLEQWRLPLRFRQIPNGL